MQKERLEYWNDPKQVKQRRQRIEELNLGQNPFVVLKHDKGGDEGPLKVKSINESTQTLSLSGRHPQTDPMKVHSYTGARCTFGNPKLHGEWQRLMYSQRTGREMI